MNSLANSVLGGSSGVEEPLVDLDEMMLTGILFNDSKQANLYMPRGAMHHQTL